MDNNKEQINPYKKYMPMFMILSNHIRLVKTHIFYFLLIFIVEKLEYTF